MNFYQDAFGSMDTEGTGMVTAQQFFELIKFLGISTSIKTVRKLARRSSGNRPLSGSGMLY